MTPVATKESLIASVHLCLLFWMFSFRADLALLGQSHPEKLSGLLGDQRPHLCLPGGCLHCPLASQAGHSQQKNSPLLTVRYSEGYPGPWQGTGSVPRDRGLEPEERDF